MNNKFALIGAAGYIAPAHMNAIKSNGGQLIAACDNNDSVGIIDSYFQDCLFFNNFERFERFVNLKQNSEDRLNYLSICSPNYLHDTHCRFALMQSMNAICEKPLVLNPWNLDMLQKTEQETGNKIFNILQLRLHHEIIKLRDWVNNQPEDKIFKIDLNYITSRGPWYHVSWKGHEEKSGGITSNIGVHFFDMLLWIFGNVKSSTVIEHNNKFAAGILELEKAEVNWFLSVDENHLKAFNSNNKRTFRSLKIDGKEIDFSDGFELLHTESYNRIINNNGFTTDQVRPVIELVHNIRNSKPKKEKIVDHPTLKRLLQFD